MTERNDQLVTDYLAEVTRATAGLRRARREELIQDLREHIEAGRAELADETEAQVRDILERLGDPEVIAEAAAEETPPPPPGVRGRRPLLIILAVAAVVALLVLCAFFLFFANSSSSSTPV